MSLADELERLKKLADDNVISQEEFLKQKEKILDDCSVENGTLTPKRKIDVKVWVKKHIAISVIAGACVVGIVITAVILVNLPTINLKRALQAEDYAALAAIKAETNNPGFSAPIEMFANDKIAETMDAFHDGLIDAATAKDALTCLESLAQTQSYISEIDDVVASRITFERGEKCAQANEYYKALIEYSHVSKSDVQNYDKAQDKLSEVRGKAKNELLEQLTDLQSNQQYDEALALIADGQAFFASDSEIINRKKEILEIQEQEKIENDRINQEVVVTDVRVEGVGFLNSNDIYVTIQNNSDKVIKEYCIGTLCFDSNGYPLVPQYEDENLVYGKATRNVQPGDKSRGGYWTEYSSDKIYAKSCVLSVDYHDGTTWVNPYFIYWRDTEKGKY